jgi:hypothetical protein
MLQKLLPSLEQINKDLEVISVTFYVNLVGNSMFFILHFKFAQHEIFKYLDWFCNVVQTFIQAATSRNKQIHKQLHSLYSQLNLELEILSLRVRLSRMCVTFTRSTRKREEGSWV